MRTDSVKPRRSRARGLACAVWRKKYGKDYAQPHTFATKSKNAQEAHEAVRPTHIEKESVGSTPEQKKVVRAYLGAHIGKPDG